MTGEDEEESAAGPLGSREDRCCSACGSPPPAPADAEEASKLASGTTSGWSPRLSAAETGEAPQAASAAQRASSLAGGWQRATDER